MVGQYDLEGFTLSELMGGTLAQRPAARSVSDVCIHLPLVGKYKNAMSELVAFKRRGSLQLF